MNTPLTFECDIHLGRRGKGARKVVEPGPAPARPAPGRVPRVARLMALAIHLDGLLQDGGKTAYVLASTFSHYGVYLYKLTFNQPSSSPKPSQALSPKAR